jgi:peptidoglycan/xylan/chitin deacetylase (PgdA/CDA1 family)
VEFMSIANAAVRCVNVQKRTLVAIAAVICLLGSSYVMWQVSRSRTFQFFGEIVPRVTSAEKVVALTFDDGPSAKTQEILSILEAAEIKATFFVIGSELEQNMRAGEQIAAAGHELGNHTYSHKRMVFITPSMVKKEIEKTDVLIRKTGYQGEIHFRPPNCKKFLALPYYLQQHERKTITWDVEPESHSGIANNADLVADYVVLHTKPGSIILLHVMYDSRQESLQALPKIIAGLKEQGYRFKTVSKLLAYDR